MAGQTIMTWLAPGISFIVLGIVGLAAPQASTNPVPAARRAQRIGGAVALVCGIAIIVHLVSLVWPRSPMP